MSESGTLGVSDSETLGVGESGTLGVGEQEDQLTYIATAGGSNNLSKLE